MHITSNVSRVPRLLIVTLAMACLLAPDAFGQALTVASNPVGVWRGTSLCRVRPSPCNDEVVVYRITRVKTSDSLSLDEIGRASCREYVGFMVCSNFTATK